MIILVALAFGLLIGWIARLVAPGNPRLTWTETIILGLVGAALGTSVINLFTDRSYDFDVEGVIASIIGAVCVLGVADVVRRRRGLTALNDRVLPDQPVREVRVPTVDIIREGENDGAEFKSTARRNLHTGERDDRMEMVVAKTVAGFLNAQGGTLLIGVDDEGAVLGIELDFEFLKKPDVDRYELWLRDHLQRTLGAVAPTHVKVSFELLAEERTVCRLDVDAADQPVFLDTPRSPRTADFYVRIGNSTRKLATDEVLQYEKQRWG